MLKSIRQMGFQGLKGLLYKTSIFSLWSDRLSRTRLTVTGFKLGGDKIHSKMPNDTEVGTEKKI